MNREFLEKLGLTDEQINSIMAQHGKSVQQMKSDLASAQAERDGYKEQVSKFDDQVKDLQKSAKDSESLTEQLNLMKRTREKEKLDFEKKLEKQAFDFALDTALRDSSARNTKAVKSLLDLENVQYVNGQFVGLSEQIEKLKVSDDYLFNSGGIYGNSPKGVNTIKPSLYTGSNPYAKETLNLTEQFKLEETNPELAKQLEELAGK